MQECKPVLPLHTPTRFTHASSIALGIAVLVGCSGHCFGSDIFRMGGHEILHGPHSKSY